MKKKIAILFLLIVSMNICSQVLIASTTPGYPTSAAGSNESGIDDIISVAGKTLMIPISGIVVAILFLVENIFNLGFNSVAGHGFPYADSVIFNAVPILDANFINPTDPSIMQSVVKKIYMTIWSIAAAFFSIALVFIGIKLATETIAHQKAKYKEAILSWIVGLIMLFLIHFFMSFVLSLNEQMVIIACNIATGNGETGTTNSNVKVTSLAKYFKDNIWRGNKESTIKGTLDLDFFYTNIVLWGMLLGQSIIVLFAYFKRMFYVVVLAFFAPVIIVVNTYQKTLLGKSQSLSNWLKEFIIAVFQQSIQAFLYAVVIQIVKESTGDEAKAGAGMLAVAALFLVLKMDDIAKSLIGWKDGMSGGLKGGLSSTLGTLALLKAGKSAVKNVGDNFSKIRNSRKTIKKEEDALDKSKARYKRQQDVYGSVDGKDNYIPPTSNVKEAAAKAPINVTQNIDVKQGETVKGESTTPRQTATNSEQNSKIMQDAFKNAIQALQNSGVNTKGIGANGNLASNNIIGEQKTNFTTEGNNTQRVENRNGQQMVGPFNSQAEVDKFNRNRLKAFDAKENFEKEKSAHESAIKDAKKLRRQGVLGSVGAAGFGAAGGIMGLGSGEIKTAMTTALGGAVAGDRVGEEVGKTKVAGLPSFAAKSLDAQTGYAISGALTAMQDGLNENIGKKFRKTQADIVKSMTKNNLIATDSATELVKSIQDKEKLATVRVNKAMEKRAQNTGQTKTVRRTAGDL